MGVKHIFRTENRPGVITSPICFEENNFVDMEFRKNFQENLMEKRYLKSNEFEPHTTPCLDVEIFKTNFN